MAKDEQSTKGTDTAWGGRFSEALDAVALRYSASVDVDKRLAPQDVRGSIAHVRMLAARGIVGEDEAEAIASGLEAIAGEIAAGDFAWDAAKEDVHMNVESALTERVGAVGGKLHTARSRNDQVATDMRLWTREACHATAERVDRFLAVLAVRAAGTVDVLMPGYTHLQRAQPVRLAHHLLAWSEMLDRDRGRLLDAANRLNESPLGCAALASTTFPLDRDRTASALGFARPMRNSLDAVADRDFLVEAVAALANCAVHLSRIAEELVLWSSQEFGFVTMSDAFTTGSSIMPQKKNPDMAELARGKTGRVVGDLVNLLVMLKGLPLAYNRDMQEDKAPVFDAFDTVDDTLDVLTGAIATATFHPARMKAALREGFLDATELADWLASKGVPFREAHHVVGRLVGRAVAEGKVLSELSLETLRAEHEAFDESVYGALDMETAVERRDLPGGPARRRVEAAIAELRGRLEGRELDVDALAGEAGAEARP
ncbi:MAG TPA: argininosuccinate lyase [Polyangiaceae bacterium LLY-WYZ-15_(1-7)]|nr:argininosuccinate lyase [Sandaracinus sp.]HJL02415.1 argininosuccinate lyase [Polyangiaceae bacterium LLY-WYZ-15_(1-7)]HJL11705.1 argininosuccinate lyase [Polyangiaceae bacterium LLY-WYZ-15_(1-7)]HJL26154.1 argininosuccinate lyase [Polyangiaceae bacterium LLY-WYZ-15_(1-7)]HJL32768.1 argininosuccinate lyase [Polyangiaceae bacterium LLY-WYZ-15_(1-7)]